MYLSINSYKPPVMSPLKKVIISCFSGTMLEFYEFAVFGYLTKQIPQLFFPNKDSFTATLLTYAVFATGFIMRPLGAILSGYLGDRRGRKSGLLFSIGLMTIPSFCIGLLPTYEQIGVLAPLLILICRMLQGISLGGEFGGSIIYLIESAPKDRPATYGAWADLGSGVGVIAATLTVLALNTFLTEAQFLQWGWRLPFLLSLIFGVIGYIIRSQLLETPRFLETPPQQLWRNPLKEVVRRHTVSFILASTLVALTGSGYYILIIYLPQQLAPTYPAYVISLIQLLSLIVNNTANFIAARLSDRLNHYRTMAIGTIGCLVLALPTVYAFTHLSLPWIFISCSLFAMTLGMCFGPRSAIVVSHFPVPIRYTGVSLSYNLGNALFGGTAPLLATLIVAYTATPLAAAILLMGMALITLMSIFGLKRV